MCNRALSCCWSTHRGSQRAAPAGCSAPQPHTWCWGPPGRAPSNRTPASSRSCGWRIASVAPSCCNCRPYRSLYWSGRNLEETWQSVIESADPSPPALRGTYGSSLTWGDTFTRRPHHQLIISALLSAGSRKCHLNVYPYKWALSCRSFLFFLANSSLRLPKGFIVWCFLQQMSSNLTNKSAAVWWKRSILKRLRPSVFFLPTASPMLSSPSSGFSSSVLLFLVLMVGLRLVPSVRFKEINKNGSFPSSVYLSDVTVLSFPRSVTCRCIVLNNTFTHLTEPFWSCLVTLCHA